MFASSWRLMVANEKWIYIYIQNLTVVRPFVRLLQTERKIRHWRKYGVVWNFSHFCPVDGCIYSFRTKLSPELWRSDFSEIQSECGVCVGWFARVTHSIYESICVRRWIDQLLHASTSNYFSIDVNKYALHFCSSWIFYQMLSECECAVRPQPSHCQRAILHFDKTQWHPIHTMCTSSMCDTHSLWFRFSAMSNKWATKRKKFIFRSEEVEKVTMTIFSTTCCDLFVFEWHRFGCEMHSPMRLFSYWKMHWTKNENIFSLSIVRNGNGVVCFRNGNPVLFGHSIDLSQCQSLSSTNAFSC